MKVTFILIVLAALLGFGLVAAAKASSAPAPAASVQASSPVAVTDDDPIPPILVWWRGCRNNDVRYTNGTVTCYKPDGTGIAWTKAVDSSGWIRIRSFPYNGGTMTGVANFIPGVP